MDWKKCKKCCEYKPLSEFNRRGKGHQSYCRDCQRVLKRQYYIDHRDTCLEQRHRNRQQNYDKVLADNRQAYAHEKGRARHALRYAVRTGKITKPDHCQVCGKVCPPRQLHGHHFDYSCPLDVVWVCPQCHAHQDAQREALAESNP